MRKGRFFLIRDTPWARTSRKWRWKGKQLQDNMTVARMDLCAKTGDVAEIPRVPESHVKLHRGPLLKRPSQRGLHSDSSVVAKRSCSPPGCLDSDVPCAV